MSICCIVVYAPSFMIRFIAADYYGDIQRMACCSLVSRTQTRHARPHGINQTAIAHRDVHPSYSEFFWCYLGIKTGLIQAAVADWFSMFIVIQAEIQQRLFGPLVVLPELQEDLVVIGHDSSVCDDNGNSPIVVLCSPSGFLGLIPIPLPWSSLIG